MSKIKSLNNIASKIIAEVASIQHYRELDDELVELVAYLRKNPLESLITRMDISDAQKLKEIGEIVGKWARKSANHMAELLVKMAGDEKLYDLFTANNLRVLKEQVSNEVKKLKLVKFTTAIELLPEDALEVRAKLERKFGKGVLLNLQVKPNVLGGFIIEKDALIIDSSLEGALEQYRHQWVYELELTGATLTQIT